MTHYEINAFTKEFDAVRSVDFLDGQWLRLDGGNIMEVGVPMTTGDGILFETVASTWAFRYKTGAGADNTGLYFNAVGGLAEWYYLNTVFWDCNVANGNIHCYGDLQVDGHDITIGDGSEATSDIIFNTSAREGTLTYNGTLDRFDYLSDIFMSGQERVYFNTTDFSIHSDSNALFMQGGSGNQNRIVIDSDLNITLGLSTVIGSGQAGVDYTLTFNGETYNYIITNMEDEGTLVLKSTKGAAANGEILQLQDSAGNDKCTFAYDALGINNLEIRFTDAENTKIGFPEAGYFAFINDSCELWLGSAADPTVYMNYYVGSGIYRGTASNRQIVQDFLTTYSFGFANNTLIMGNSVTPAAVEFNPTNGIIMNTSKRIYFRDAGIYINSSVDGVLFQTADARMDFESPIYRFGDFSSIAYIDLLVDASNYIATFQGYAGSVKANGIGIFEFDLNESSGGVQECVRPADNDLVDLGDTANTLKFRNGYFTGQLEATSGLKREIVAKTAAYTATIDDEVITCGAGNETFTIDLPAVSSGKVYYIKNVGTGTITVDANTTGSTTIDGSNTKALAQYETIQVIADASVYWIL